MPQRGHFTGEQREMTPVPAKTALRLLKAMVDQSLFVRRADSHDGRRVFVELAPQTSEALHRYFAEVDRTLMI